ncbi:MAG: winged helix-turn-helix domain-containing protein [Marinicella sp.]
MESAIIIGQFKVFPSLGIVESPQGQVSLQPKVIKLLCYFAENPNKVLTRDQIVERVWDGRVVSDDALHRLISIIRNTFDDDAKQPLYLETIPKVGYRLIAEVRAKKNGSAAPSKYGKYQLSGLFVLVMVALVTVFLTVFKNDEPSMVNIAPKFHYLTTHKGLEQYPRFSSDDKYIVFTQRGLSHLQLNGTYIKDISTLKSSTNSIPLSSGDDFYAVWSPNGSDIYTVSKFFDSCQIIKHVFLTNISSKFHDCHSVSVNPIISLDVATNGMEVIGSEFTNNRKLFKYTLSGEKVKKDKLLDSEEGENAFYPRYSKDGKYLAFAKNTESNDKELIIFDFENGKIRQVTHQNSRIKGLAWTPDNKIIYISNLNGEYGLWMIDPFTDNPPKWLLYNNEYLHSIDVSNDGEKLVFHTYERPHNIYRLNIFNELSQLTSSRRQIHYPVFSEHDNSIIYVSNESGSFSVWQADTNFQNQKLIVPDTGRYAAPQPSPNGELLLFATDESGNYDLCLLDKLTNQSCIVKDKGDQMFPTWSQDGSSIYFTDYSDSQTALPKLMRYDLAQKTTEVVAENGIFMQDAGNLGYYKSLGEGAIYEVNYKTKQSKIVINDAYKVYLNNLLLVNNDIYYIDINKDLRQYSLADKTSEVIYAFRNKGNTAYSGLSVNPSNGDFFLALTDPELNGDVTLIENLQQLINQH